jgi:GNAT superfamily N-acetyltransferase
MSQADSDSVHARPAVAADASAVADLASDLAQSFAFSRTAFDRVHPVLLAGRDASVLLAVNDWQPIGYLFGVTHLTFYANGPVAVVEEILVRPQHRRRGIGRSLMTAFESWASGLGCVQVTLATRRAIPFYQSLLRRDSDVAPEDPHRPPVAGTLASGVPANDLPRSPTRSAGRGMTVNMCYLPVGDVRSRH